MRRNLGQMSRQSYDVLIIGGGINGAAIAYDASLRGLKVALVEKKDFASGTTSASSKLAHGGLRYLKNLEFGLVRESLKERRILQRIAPHLVHPLPFVMPLYKEGRNRKGTIKLGMMLYDLLSYDKSWTDYEDQKIQGHKMLSVSELLNKEPLIFKEGLVGGVQYFDCQISSPERLCLEFILSAVENGADVSNYAEVKKILVENNKINGVIVRDHFSGKDYNLQSQMVVNASGPWLDKVINLYDRNHKPIIRGTKGIHIITRQKLVNNALILTPKNPERSFIIFEPWKGRTLIGTTDVDYKESLDEVHATKEDILNFIKEINEVSKADISLEDLVYSYAGVRPLAYAEGNESKLSRKYHIKEEKIHGIITIVGGKITTARRLAEKVGKLLYKKLGKGTKYSNTDKKPLFGSTKCHKKYLEMELIKDSNYIIDNSIKQHLINLYGSKYEDVLSFSLSCRPKKISTKRLDLKAQVIYAIEEEMAMTLEDVMLRRTDMATSGSPGCFFTFEVASIMSDYLGWSKERLVQEFSSFQKKVAVKKWLV